MTREVLSVGSSKLIENLDPFIHLGYRPRSQEFKGFRDHAHRGFEIITFCIDGRQTHEDFLGNKGVLDAGDVQFMTVGRGIVHCELVHPDKPFRCIQLWVNLAHKHKMVEPKYKDLLSINIPSRTENGVHVKIVTGECMGFSVPSYTYTSIYYLDFRLESNASFTQKIPEDWNAFILILDGTATIGTNKLLEVDSQNVVVLTREGDSVTFKNEKPHLLRLVLVAGMPLNEPVVQNGPFVMSTDAEIEQAYKDLQMFKNGFENAREWLSNAVKEKKF